MSKLKFALQSHQQIILSMYLGYLALGNFKEDGKLSVSNYKCHCSCVIHNESSRMRVVSPVAQELELEHLGLE